MVCHCHNKYWCLATVLFLTKCFLKVRLDTLNVEVLMLSLAWVLLWEWKDGLFYRLLIETGFHYYPVSAQASSSQENFVPVRKMQISTYSLCSHGNIGWLRVVSFFCPVLEHSRQNSIRQKLFLALAIAATAWTWRMLNIRSSCWSQPLLDYKESSVLLYSVKPTQKKVVCEVVGAEAVSSSEV